ncbi:MAG: aminoacyl-tRNA hydrolase [Chlamydiae bacterium GWC2_50_10]|nr:MAG: aminoacyl-tRNA hydrolase [Chlamydiae bacterium GWA2_50_15]OGN54101.1 MAG: aminoacyl-tRNA hydrolase [Chlamydiae bacterium GWC2_50_10]OGN54479.1 MAG: aminoacyl-tRNA hydrolase [Chlamydiae bacterium GWF2_49_8]OGN57564.1 MAG: aminoacyl-tRNA hydrolase [Chlamydiae bacterium RIFCSPHIGHO2_02_FULL_49_29]OGN63073.1 MAG: aminoacyl-tRNA hydrolase [Chlamydiae bacterium RIFCSPHIGHO2_12_FULL_49_32]OGN74777.1 MAG: aminoacyl-tRNA hydrolase [Chlamydiae bacterium RIFCSPLOWO2_12_FULL_49_12]HAZ15102.1 amin
MEKKKLIVGLGNPGREYEKTRHNMGYEVVKAFAEKQRLSFKRKFALLGRVAMGVVSDKQIVLLLPTTYMNRSGSAVKRCLTRYRIGNEELLVIVDDVDLPFGKLRMREKGSSGGHNGLKSIEETLGTQNYARLRVGISDHAEGELADYVLARFTSDESVQLPLVIEEAVDVVQRFVES